MNYQELIEKRQSIRRFQDKKLSEEQEQALQQFFLEEERLIPALRTQLLLFGGDAGLRLEGVAGYGGNAFLAPCYGVLLSEPGRGAMENSGFLMEGLILKSTELGLDSCWLTVEDSAAVKRALRIDSPLTVTAVTALGYGKPEREGKRLDIATPANVRFESRPGHLAPKISQLAMVYQDSFGTAPCYEEDSFDPYLDKALYAASLSPSFMNRQSYRYLLFGSYVYLLETREELVSERDRRLGIGATMYHFYKVYSEYSRTGYRWELETERAEEAMAIPESYEIVAKMRLW